MSGKHVDQCSFVGILRPLAPSHAAGHSSEGVLAEWKTVADILDNQGEVVLAGDVRYFAKHLPPVRTDRERLAIQCVDYVRSTAAERAQSDAKLQRREPPVR